MYIKVLYFYFLGLTLELIGGFDEAITMYD